MKKKLLIMSFLFMFCLSFDALAKDIYVSTSGNDYSGDGTYKNPYKTLERADFDVRCSRKNNAYPKDGIKIVIMDDEFYVEKPLLLDEMSGGTAEFPVVYTSYGNSKIKMSAEIDFSDCEKASPDELLGVYPEAADKIFKIDLSEIGIKNAANINMLYANNKILQPARYPNKGYYTPTKVYNRGSEVSDDVTKRSYIMSADYERMNSWTNVTSIDIKGFPRFMWAFDQQKIKSIENNKITSSRYAKYGLFMEARLWFENIKEEIDMPGEWCVDTGKNVIYFYPAYNFEHKINIVYNADNIINMNKAQNIRFENLNFEGSAKKAIDAIMCRNVVIDKCSVSYCGDKGISFKNSNSCGINNSVVTKTGTGGIYIGGGDDINLADSNNYVSNCDIFDYDNINCVSCGIIVEGVGNRIFENSIHDAFHNAVAISGNNNIIKDNEIYNVLVGTDDAGAIYMYANARYRGNTIENNYIHHLGTGGESVTNTSVSAIYFDGFTSAQTVKNNIIYDSAVGINVNGGGYMNIHDNVFVNTGRPLSIHRSQTSPITYWERLNDIRFNKNIWYQQYPELKNHTSGDPYVFNRIDNNIFVDCGDNFVTAIENDIPEGEKFAVKMTDCINMDKTIFNNSDNMDFTIADKNKVYASIPDFVFYNFNNIGRKF